MTHLIPDLTILSVIRGSQWTGAYVMEFRDLINLPQMEAGDQGEEEARFSFLKGGYIEDFENQGRFHFTLLCLQLNGYFY